MSPGYHLILGQKVKGQHKGHRVTKCKNILKAIEWPAWVMNYALCRVPAFFSASFVLSCCPLNECEWMNSNSDVIRNNLSKTAKMSFWKYIALGVWKTEKSSRRVEMSMLTRIHKKADRLAKHYRTVLWRVFKTKSFVDDSAGETIKGTHIWTFSGYWNIKWHKYLH